MRILLVCALTAIGAAAQTVPGLRFPDGVALGRPWPDATGCVAGPAAFASADRSVNTAQLWYELGAVTDSAALAALVRETMICRHATPLDADSAQLVGVVVRDTLSRLIVVFGTPRGPTMNRWMDRLSAALGGPTITPDQRAAWWRDTLRITLVGGNGAYQGRVQLHLQSRRGCEALARRFGTGPDAPAAADCWRLEHPPGPPRRAPAASRDAPVRRVPPPGDDEWWGLQLGRPLAAGLIGDPQCFRGPAYLWQGLRYRATVDDELFRVPHEHRDSVAVRRALEGIRVCGGALPGIGALAVAVLEEGDVVRFTVTWPEEPRPSYDDLAAILEARFGAAAITREGSRWWHHDGVLVGVIDDAWWLPGFPQVHVMAVAACERFEARVHADAPAPRYTDPAANACWVDP